jgi:hypothetical protein
MWLFRSERGGVSIEHYITIGIWKTAGSDETTFAVSERGGRAGIWGPVVSGPPDPGDHPRKTDVIPTSPTWILWGK